MKTYITRYHCHTCNAVYDIDSSFEESNCPAYATYKEGEFLTCDDFTTEELTDILRKNNVKPKEGTIVVPLKKGDKFIYIKDEGYKKRESINLKKNN